MSQKKKNDSRKFNKKKAKMWAIILAVIFPVLAAGAALVFIDFTSYREVVIDPASNVNGSLKLIINGQEADLSDGKLRVPDGAEIIFNVTPEEGYYINSITIGGEDQEITAGYGESQSVYLGSLDTSLDVVVDFKIQTFTVKFIDHDGTELKSEEVEYGSTVTPPSDPTRAGHVFAGWNTTSFENITSNLTVTAQYTTNKYNVKFIGFKGVELDSQTIEYGSSATGPEAPVVAGHTFKGWDIAFDQITANTTVTAIYEINKYTVTFVGFNGAGLGTQQVEYQGSATAPEIPEVEGYNFKEWDKPLANITSNITIKAIYEIKTFAITTVAGENGKIDGQANIGWGNNHSVTITPNAGYYIKSVLVDGGAVDFKINANGTCNYTIIGIKKAYEVSATFERLEVTIAAGITNGEVTTETDLSKVKYGDEIEFTVKPDTGYNVQSVKINNNVIPTTVVEGTNNKKFVLKAENKHNISAEFTLTKWSVTVVSPANGTIEPDQIDGKVEYGTVKTFIITPKYGYQVNKILVDGVEAAPTSVDGFVQTYELTVVDNHTIEVEFVEREFTVTFIGFNGADLGSQPVKYLKPAAAPEIPEVAGHTFVKWDVAFDSITEDITVTAIYEKKEYVVSFKVDGKLFSTKIVKYEALVSEPETNPTKTGHTFKRWDWDFKQAITGTTTINAIFEINKYTVTFMSDGNVYDEQTVEHGSSATAPETDPTKTGYTFSGWDVAFNNITGDLVVNAVFDINYYSVKFMVDGVQYGEVQSIAYGSSAETPADPVKTGYTFTGWDVAFNNITGDLVVNAQFVINKHTITTSVAGAGTITETATVDWGTENYVVTVTPAEGHHIESIYVDGEPVEFTANENGACQYTLTEVKKDYTIEATFAINTYTITTSKVGEGTITETATVDWGTENYVVTIAPAEGHHIDKIEGIADSLQITRNEDGSLTCTISNVKKDYEINVTFAINKYTVTFKVDGVQYGEVQSISHGSSAETPTDPSKPGHTFTGWDVAFDNITSDLEVNAQFDINKHTITTSVAGAGTITETATVDWGTENYVVTITPEKGYFISNIAGIDETVEVVENADGTVRCTINKVEKDYTIEATIEALSVIISDSITNGTVTTSTDLTALTYGQEITFTVEPVTGYYVQSIKVNDKTISLEDVDGTNNKTFVIAVKGQYEISAEFTATQWSVTVKDVDPLIGTIEPDQVSGSIDYGTAITFTITPNYGYQVNKILVDGVEAVPTSVEGFVQTYKLTVTTNHTVEVEFVEREFTVTFIGFNGADLGSQQVKYKGGATAPDPNVDGYTFTGWDVSFDNITEDTIVKAQYAINKHTITTSKVGEGTITETATVDWGTENYVVTVTPAEGHHIESVSVDGEPVEFTAGENGACEYTLTEVKKDYEINVTFAINKYTVTFKVDGVQYGEAQSIAYESKATKPEIDPTKTGYTFSGWDWDFDQPITGTTTINAQFDINYYTVKFMVDGVQYGEVQSIAHGSAATAPEDPDDIDGYIFTGWDVEFDEVTSDLTVTAQYAIAHIVTFVNWDGQVIKTQKVQEGTGATAPETTPSKENHTFTGWDVEFDEVTSDLTVTAQFELNKYTVTFMSDGNVYDEQTVEHGSSATEPVSPEKAGHTFVKWDVAFDNITANTTITAIFDINEYTVTFIGFNGKELDVQSVEYESPAIAPEAPVVEGYTFVKWDVAFNKIVENTTVTAIYSVNTYTVVFMSDGKVYEIMEVAYGTPATAPVINPSKTGYTFTGWDAAFDNITADTTINAVFEINKYTVTFIVDGQPYGESQTVEYGSAATAPEAPEIEGYTFKGWDVAFNNITANTIVTAIYEVNTYTVSFIGFDGSTLDVQTIEHGSAAEAPEAPAVEGHTFIKWNVAFNNITSDTTVTAVYEINKYTVTFMSDGKVHSEQKVAWTDSAVTPSDPTKLGHTFVEWDKAYDNITSDLVVTAIFKINTYTITPILVDESKGSISEEVTVEWDKSATMTITPVDGYYITAVKVNNVEVEFTVNEDGSCDYVFNNVVKHYTIQATFEKITVEIVDAEKGSITTSADLNNLKYGDEITITFTPETNCYVDQISINDGVYVEGTESVGTTVQTYTLKVTESYSITAVFKQLYIDISSEIENGSVTTTTDLMALTYGQTVEFIVSATEGYNIGIVTVNGVEVELLEIENSNDKKFTITVTGGHDISAIFNIKVYKVTFIGLNGEELEVQDVEHGSPADEPEAPFIEGYVFVEWDKSFDIITSDTTVTARYEVTHTVTFMVDGEQYGDVQIIKTGTGAIRPDDPVKEGHTFTGWDKEFDNITENTVVNAIFEINKYTITTSAGEHGTIADSVTVDWGTELQEILITPDDGYYIETVTVDGESKPVEVLNGNAWAYKFTDIKEAHDIHATFAARNPYFDNTEDGGITYVGSETATEVPVTVTVNGRGFTSISNLPETLTSVILEEELTDAVNWPNTFVYVSQSGEVVENPTAVGTYMTIIPGQNYSVNNYKYYYSATDNNWYISGVPAKSDNAVLTIPSTLTLTNGAEIDIYGLYSNVSATTAVENVTSGYTSVVISNGIDYIGDGAFINATSLTSVTLNGNTSFSTTNYNIFSGCSKITTLTTGSEVTQLPSTILTKYLTGLEKIVLGKALTSSIALSNRTISGFDFEWVKGGSEVTSLQAAGTYELKVAIKDATVTFQKFYFGLDDGWLNGAYEDENWSGTKNITELNSLSTNSSLKINATAFQFTDSFTYKENTGTVATLAVTYNGSGVTSDQVTYYKLREKAESGYYEAQAKDKTTSKGVLQTRVEQWPTDKDATRVRTSVGIYTLISGKVKLKITLVTGQYQSATGNYKKGPRVTVTATLVRP